MSTNYGGRLRSSAPALAKSKEGNAMRELGFCVGRQTAKTIISLGLVFHPNTHTHTYKKNGRRTKKKKKEKRKRKGQVKTTERAKQELNNSKH